MNTCFLVEVDPPEWVQTSLVSLSVLLAALLLLWLIVSVFLSKRRKAYNLTRMENVAGGSTQSPSFLQVDHEARDAAKKRGDDYVRPSDREISIEAPSQDLGIWPKVGALARLGTVLVALLNIAVAIVAAMIFAGEANRLFDELSVQDRWQSILERYWIGIGVAVLLIIFEIVKYFSHGPKKARS